MSLQDLYKIFCNEGDKKTHPRSNDVRVGHNPSGVFPLNEAWLLLVPLQCGQSWAGLPERLVSMMRGQFTAQCPGAGASLERPFWLILSRENIASVLLESWVPPGW